MKRKIKARYLCVLSLTHSIKISPIVWLLPFHKNTLCKLYPTITINGPRLKVLHLNQYDYLHTLIYLLCSSYSEADWKSRSLSSFYLVLGRYKIEAPSGCLFWVTFRFVSLNTIIWSFGLKALNSKPMPSGSIVGLDLYGSYCRKDLESSGKTLGSQV